MSDKDTARIYTDNQGKEFPILAGSEAESWRLAQITIAAHDREYRAELEAKEDAREQRHAAYSKTIDMAIDVPYQKSKAYTRAEVSKGAGRNGLQGSLAQNINTSYCSPDISYPGASGGDANRTTSASTTTDNTYSSGYGLSCVEMFVVGVIVIVVVVFMAVWL